MIKNVLNLWNTLYFRTIFGYLLQFRPAGAVKVAGEEDNWLNDFIN